MWRWFLLLLTLWPTVYMGVFAYLLVAAFVDGDDRLFAPVFIAAHVLAFGLSVALFCLYLRDVTRRGLSSESQAIWGVLFGLLGPPAMLAYWVRYVSAPSR